MLCEEKLTGKEEPIWERAMLIMGKDIDTPLCETFISPVWNEEAVCCVSIVDRGRVAFCTLRKFIKEGATPQEGELKKIINLFTRSYSARFTFNDAQDEASAAGLNVTEDPVEGTVCINLFEVPCKPQINDYLCSQYVSGRRVSCCDKRCGWSDRSPSFLYSSSAAQAAITKEIFATVD